MIDAISLLSSDEELDDDYGVERGMEGNIYGSSKRMRLVGSDHPVAIAGKQCISAMERLEELQDESEAAESGSFPSPQDEYNRKIDALHSGFAIEIQKREDELSRLRAQQSTQEKLTQTSAKLICDAANEVARLQQELAKQKKEADTQLAKAVQSGRDAVATAEKAAAAAEQKAASSAAATRVKAADVLNKIIADVDGHLIAKETKERAAAAATLASMSVKASVSQPVVWIKQTNQDPQYNYTTREIAYTRPAKGSSAGKWHFDDSNKKNDPNAQSIWVEILDSTVIGKLLTLGAMSKVNKIFKAKRGKKCSYTFGNHTYEVEVVYGVKPWVAAAAAQAPAASNPAAIPAKPLGHAVLLNGPYFQPSTAQVQMYDSELDTDEDMHEVIGSKLLADLATRWSALSLGFKYDPAKTELWVKPRWLATWLDMLQHRGEYEIRIVGHGVRSNNFDALRKDPAGFNLAYSKEGRVGFGCYVSPLDAIPADYTRHGGLNTDGKTYKNTDGTIVLGLLLVNKQNASHISTSTSGNSYQDHNGAYEFYHLGSSRQNYIGRDYTVNDAYNVRDQTLLLPLGKIVAF